MNFSQIKSWKSLIVVLTMIVLSNDLSAQTVETPSLLSVESNGVELYTSNGYENGLQPIPFVALPQPSILTISDYSLDDINTMLLQLEWKLAEYQNANDQASIDLLLEYQLVLLAQKEILSNSN